MDPLNKRLSLSPGDVRAQSGQSRLTPKLFAKTCRSIEFQAGSCLYVTVAVKAASHFGTAYVAAAAEACSRLVGVCRELRCTHSTYILTRQVFLGLGNEVWFHRFPSPSIGFPFHPFPLHTLLFLFLSFMSFLASCPAYTSVLALGCTCTSTVHLGFRSPRF